MNIGSFGLGDGPFWPEGGAWPEWFVFGDPHENFCVGDVLYDHVRLEVLR